MYKKRTYRNLVKRENLVSFRTVVKETDLSILAEKHLDRETTDIILKYRGYIESYISLYPEFATTLVPWINNVSDPNIIAPNIVAPNIIAPNIINDMIKAGIKANVGPMAAIAGSIAEYVGNDLMAHSREVVVENGGDIFLMLKGTVTIGIFAGESPLSMKMGVCIDTKNQPLAVCTSSGTIGHSLSMGKADAVCVISRSCSLADAAATSIGNQIKTKADINKSIDFGKKIDGIIGIVVIMDDKIGLWGDIEVIPLKT
ncbi:MAG: UPF0280 family protein [Desulfobacterales bacterium]|jgi:uncharacterized protein|nr:UPF0280 family protein [Desulfobacterales bacterium]